MSLECADKALSVAAIKRAVEEEEYSFDNVVQRGMVWNAQQKSNFIYSLARGFRVPYLYAKKKTVKTDDGSRVVYDVFDGKQRMNTIFQYLSGTFRLKQVKPVTYTENKKKQTIDISGMFWNDLPEALQKYIEEQMLTMIVYDNITQDELTEMFIMLNNGKPLTSKNKALAHCADRDNMLRIGKHPIFNSSLLKKKGRENKDEVVIIAKCWMMLNQELDDLNFGGKNLNANIEQIKIDKANEKKLVSIFDYADDVLQILMDKNKKLGQRFTKEIHFVSLVPFMNMAIEKKIKCGDFADFVEKNFDINTKDAFSQAYSDASTNGAAQGRNIRIRHNEIEKAFKKAFK